MLTGFRLSEIQKLRWEYVGLGAGELRLLDAKTGFNFIPGTVDAIQRQACPNGL